MQVAPVTRAELDIYFNYDEKTTDALRVIDGLPDDYLETESFARQSGWAEAIDYNLHASSVLYTLDMRAIPEFNDQTMEIVEGRSLTAEDADVCVVSKEFLKAYALSVGDSISIQLGDRFYHGDIGVTEGEDIPQFEEAAELSIVGAYSNSSGVIDTIFVPSALLPVEVPNDYETKPDEFSVFVENADDIEAFYEAAGQFVENLDLDLEFSDRGWMDVKDSLGMGAFVSLLTTLLYIAGAVLALFLAVYLYIGRNKKSYAIMRMLGVPGKKAGSSVLLPFVVAAVLAVSLGAAAGLYYAQKTAQKALAGMAESAPVGYVPNTGLPISVLILCLMSELLFVSLAAYFFLHSMKKTPPLELLQEGRNPGGRQGLCQGIRLSRRLRLFRQGLIWQSFRLLMTSGRHERITVPYAMWPPISGSIYGGQSGRRRCRWFWQLCWPQASGRLSWQGLHIRMPSMNSA